MLTRNMKGSDFNNQLGLNLLKGNLGSSQHQVSGFLHSTAVFQGGKRGRGIWGGDLGASVVPFLEYRVSAMPDGSGKRPLSLMVRAGGQAEVS